MVLWHPGSSVLTALPVLVENLRWPLVTSGSVLSRKKGWEGREGVITPAYTPLTRTWSQDGIWVQGKSDRCPDGPGLTAYWGVLLLKGKGV